jgi:hypothetical protein
MARLEEAQRAAEIGLHCMKIERFEILCIHAYILSRGTSRNTHTLKL